MARQPSRHVPDSSCGAIGNSAALILDKPILDLLNVTIDTPLEISTDGRSIIISPAAPDSDQVMRASLDRINAKFATTLSRLAE